jgi:hypothetical protein
MVTILDTHKTVRRLREAGFDEAQAETLTEILRESGEGYRQEFVTRPDLSHFATKADLTDLATKADLAQVASQLASKSDLAQFATKADVAQLPTHADLTHLATKADLASLEARYLKWLVPILLGQVALIVGLLRLL